MLEKGDQVLKRSRISYLNVRVALVVVFATKAVSGNEMFMLENDLSG